MRVAPSPTGKPHLGIARTALFNYLFAKKFGGKFVLRIEDTDQERSKPEFEKEILDCLRWLGIDWDEGPDIGGPFGPYRQSERREIYKKYLKRLIEEKHAYFCFCTPEEVENQKQYKISIGEPPVYSGKCSNLTEEEVEKNLKEGKKFVLRLRVPAKKVYFEDLLRGKIEFDTHSLGDFILARDLENPLYNLACVVDDFEMKISHIIRGEDHISNVPKQILIQDALNFPRPKYLHLPLVLGPDRTKLSKRDQALSISELREEGYLPEALFHFLVLLGFTPPEERDFYPKEYFTEYFSIERIHKSPAIFNIKKLEYLNGVYIRKLPIKKITQYCAYYLIKEGLLEPIFEYQDLFPEAGGPGILVGKEIYMRYKVLATNEVIEEDDLEEIVKLYQERLKKISEISSLVDFFFKKDLRIEKSLFFWKDIREKEVKEALSKVREILENLPPENFKKEVLSQILIKESEEFSNKIRQKIDRGYLLWPLRVALTGKESSAPPFDILEILGKEKSIERIKRAQQLFKTFGFI